jgi:predicted permease
MDPFITFYGITIIPSAIACHYIAKARGCNPVKWGTYGVFLGLFALPFIFFCKSKNPKIEVRPD